MCVGVLSEIENEVYAFIGEHPLANNITMANLTHCTQKRRCTDFNPSCRHVKHKQTNIPICNVVCREVESYLMLNRKHSK